VEDPTSVVEEGGRLEVPATRSIILQPLDVSSSGLLETAHQRHFVSLMIPFAGLDLDQLSASDEAIDWMMDAETAALNDEMAVHR